MTASKLTKEEHHARAMLMQREFLPWANAYVDLAHGTRWLDADTMEPLDLNEVSLRIQKTLDLEPYKKLGLPWVTDKRLGNGE